MLTGIITEGIKNILTNKLKESSYDESFKVQVNQDIDNAMNELFCDFDDLVKIYTENSIFIDAAIADLILFSNSIDITTHSHYIQDVLSFLFSKEFMLICYENIDGFDAFAKKQSKKLNNIMLKYPEIYILISNFIDELFNPQYAILLDNNISDLVVDGVKETNIVKIKEKPKQICLYHGTSYENYLKIKEEGYILPTQYKDINVSKSRMSKLLGEYYPSVDNYVFLDSGLDIPIDYACGQYRKNILDFDSDNRDISVYERLHLDLNSQGVIFAVNPNKYNLYFKADTNEFLIDSKIDIKDAKPYFVKRTNGIISIFDEEGNETYDLCYE